MVPEDLTTVEVRSDGLNFDPPTVAFVEPQTLARRLVSGILALVAGFFFVNLLRLSVVVVLQFTKTDAYVYAVHVSAREVDVAFTTVRCVLYSTVRVVTERVVLQTLRIVSCFDDM